jgi:glycosyltransferase involved in cell wall biosynthesis
MRIAYLTPTFPPYPGGIGINAYYNAREMMKHGYEIEVFTPCYKSLFDKDNQIKLKRQEILVNSNKSSSIPTDFDNSGLKVYFLRPLISYGKAAFLPQLLWRLHKFDIVHCYYPFFGGAEIAVLARKIWRFKLIIHHEMDVVGEGWLKKFFLWHTRYILPWILKNSDCLFVLSEDYFKNSDIGRLYEKDSNRLPPLKIVPNGVDTDFFRPRSMVLLSQPVSVNETVRPPIGKTEKQPQDKEENCLSNNDRPIILFAGGLDKAHYFKGKPELLQAMAILKKDNFVAVLKIAGEGELKQKYQSLTRELGIDDRVEFVGLLPHNQLPEFYNQGSLFVMPSVGRTESFSIATAEAQACGLPAIVSDLPGVRVTIQNGVTGLLVKPGDSADLAEKIKLILSNQSLRTEMGKAGRARMEKYFSWQTIGDKLENIYQELIKAKK